MKFKELTEKQIKRISDIHSDKTLSWDDRMMKLRNYTSKGEEKLKSERTVRKWTERLGLTKPTEAISPQYEEAKKKVLSKKGVYIIGYAQNNTPVIDKLFTNMESYAKFHNASIHIIAGRYKNPTSVHTEKKYDTWAKRLTPYLDASRHDIHKQPCDF